MKNNKIFLVTMVFCLMLSLCACGSSEPAETTEAPAVTIAPVQTEAPAETEADGNVTYTVKVVDEGGNPVSGAKVQMCLESCLPGKTDENGVATFTTVEDDYHVSFMVMPEGYEYTTEETEWFFEAGSYEMTITLKAVA